MYKIALYDKLAEEGFKKFDANKYTVKVKDELDNPDGILVHSTPLHDEKFGDNLKSIVRIGAGVNTIPVDQLTKMGVAVFNCPGGNANAVKELTIAAMIMVMRNGFKAMNWVQSLPEEESAAGKTVEKGKEQFRGPEILGKTIGVIGAGAIGGRMVKACDDLGMKVLAYDPYLSNAKVQELSQYCNFVENINDLLKVSDIVTVHIPFNAENKEFVNKAMIDQMKDGVYLVNYARGQVVDNEAICDALESGKIAGYATDFPTPDQMKRNDVLYTPHLGAGTPEADINCSVMAAHETIDYIENGNISNSVNLPNVTFQRAEGSRICVIHDNKRGMLDQMIDVVVKNDLNIENLVNKAKGDIAYTIMDFDVEVQDIVAQKIEPIEGVVRVRLLK